MMVRAIFGRLRERHGVLLRLVAVLVVLGGVDVGAAALLSGQVPANARVGGFAIGGMTPGQAEVTFNRLPVAKTSAPVHVTVPPRSIVISAVGTAVKVPEPADAVVAGWPDRRTVQVVSTATRSTVVPVSPKVTTATAAGWGIRGVISTFTTHFPFNPPRTSNIKIAARTLNGTLVRPGAQFSLNATLGRRTAAKGYQLAPVIYAGRLVKGYGGGVSQVSTTTFNAAFFAGVRIDRYTPHSFYISRYPEGREATVSWPDVDQRWTNDTGHGILIKASVRGSNITVTFLGAKVWDIEAVKGPRRNVRQPKVVVDPRPDCVPQSPAPGFDVTVTRIFKKGGSVVKAGHFNTHYLPENSVRCTRPASR